MLKWLKLAITVEIVGICLVSTGIAYEISIGQEVGLIFITVGSVVVAVGSLLHVKVRNLFKEMGRELAKRRIAK